MNQRYGCTIVSVEPDGAPSFCPYPYNAGWHQGIDFNLSSGTTLYSQVTGTVAAAVTSCLASNCALGYLAIKSSGDGHIVYLLHGSPTSNYTQVGAPVQLGAAIYTTGSNGLSTGPHLHFEVHTSVVGELSVAVGPGDDINPEAWLNPTSQWQTAQAPHYATINVGYYASSQFPAIHPLSWYPNPSTRTDAYYLVSNGLIGQTLNVDGLTWVAYAPLSVGGNAPTFVSSPQPSSPGIGLGRIDLFVVGSDNNVWDVNYDLNCSGGSPGWVAVNWGTPAPGLLAGTIPRALDWGSWGSNCSALAVQVYVRGADGLIYSREWSNAGFYSWTVLNIPASAISSDAHPVGTPPNSDVFFRGAVTNGRYPLYHYPWGSSTYSDFAPIVHLGNPPPNGDGGNPAPSGEPFPVSSSSGRFDVFFTDQNADLWDAWYDPVQGAGTNNLTSGASSNGSPAGDPAVVIDATGGCGCDVIFEQTGGWRYLYSYRVDGNGITPRSPGGIPWINTVRGTPGLGTFTAGELTAIWPDGVQPIGSNYDYIRYWTH